MQRKSSSQRISLLRSIGAVALLLGLSIPLCAEHYDLNPQIDIPSLRNQRRWAGDGTSYRYYAMNLPPEKALVYGSPHYFYFIGTSWNVFIPLPRSKWISLYAQTDIGGIIPSFPPYPGQGAITSIQLLLGIGTQFQGPRITFSTAATTHVIIALPFTEQLLSSAGMGLALRAQAHLNLHSGFILYASIEGGGGWMELAADQQYDYYYIGCGVGLIRSL